MAGFKTKRRYFYIGLSSLALGVCISFFDLYKVQGNSMEPTVGNKAIIVLFNFEFKNYQIKRDNLILLNIDGKKMLKRVIGLPGDTLKAINGILEIKRGHFREYKAIRESDKTLSNWHYDYLVGDVNFREYTPNPMSWGPVHVPKGSYFVLGDNLRNSLDSRSFGYVKKDEVINNRFIIL